MSSQDFVANVAPYARDGRLRWIPYPGERHDQRKSPGPWRRLEVGYVDLHVHMNRRNTRKLRREIYGPSKKQLPKEELGLPTMLKA